MKQVFPQTFKQSPKRAERREKFNNLMDSNIALKRILRGHLVYSSFFVVVYLLLMCKKYETQEIQQFVTITKPVEAELRGDTGFLTPQFTIISHDAILTCRFLISKLNFGLELICPNTYQWVYNNFFFGGGRVDMRQGVVKLISEL